MARSGTKRPRNIPWPDSSELHKSTKRLKQASDAPRYSPPVTRSISRSRSRITRPCAVSWGVEVEFVLAFHHEILEQVLKYFDRRRRPTVVDGDDIDHEKILKEIYEEIKSDTYDHRKRWPTRLLAVKDLDTAVSFLYGYTGVRAHQWYHYPVLDAALPSKNDEAVYHRTYAMEPMLIAQDILHRSGISVTPIGIVVHPNEPSYALIVNQDREVDQNKLYSGLNHPGVSVSADKLLYDHWMLTRDQSVPPATRDEVGFIFSLPDDEKASWESDGIELISPKFVRRDLDYGLQLLRNIFNALRYRESKFESNFAKAEGLVDNEIATRSGADHDDDDQFEDDQNEAGEDDQPREYASLGGYGALESVFAGVHCHIGLDFQGRASERLLILKHIAFITIANEELISSLHPFRRRGKVDQTISPLSSVFPSTKHPRTRSQTMLEEVAAEETRITELREKYVSTVNLHSNHVWFMDILDNAVRPGIRTLTQEYIAIADKILDRRSPAAEFFYMVQPHVADDQDGAVRMVHCCLIDFSRVAKHLGVDSTDHLHLPPCTIEFRQHGCTLDADEIRHWVKFLFALIDLAERRAFQVTDHKGRTLTLDSKESDKYAGPVQSIEELCGSNNLDLSPDEIQYWVARAARYANDEEDFIDKTRARRKRRGFEKASHGHASNEADITAIWEGVPTRPEMYRNLSRIELLNLIDQRLNLEQGYEPDRSKLEAVARKRLVDLIGLAKQMDENLRLTGLYAPPNRVDKDGIPISTLATRGLYTAPRTRR